MATAHHSIVQLGTPTKVTVIAKPRDNVLPAINNGLKSNPASPSFEDKTRKLSPIAATNGGDWNQSVKVDRKSKTEKKNEMESIEHIRSLTLKKAEVLLLNKKDSNQSITQERKEKEKERIQREREYGPKDEKLEKILEIQKKKREATKVHVFEHTGTFEYSKWEECKMWSCCLRTNEEATPCTLVKSFYPDSIDYEEISA